MPRKVYPVDEIFRPEKRNNGRLIPIEDVKLYWVRNNATASLGDIDTQPLYRDEKRLPKSTVAAQGRIDVPISWISEAGRKVLYDDKLISQWTNKETKVLSLDVSFRYWKYYFRGQLWLEFAAVPISCIFQMTDMALVTILSFIVGNVILISNHGNTVFRAWSSTPYLRHCHVLTNPKSLVRSKEPA